ncbi:MAG: site-2 protease family protein [Candidatus Paceibacterota bacterium]|jgi:Zn-dependent protease
MTDTIFFIIILIISVVIHEVSHGYVALYFGDETAKRAGRLTLNPLKHLDMFGSIILPLLLIVLKSPFLIGWAKPVPYNPYNFNNVRKGTFFVSSAGVLANIFIALIFGLILRFFFDSSVLTQNLSLIHIISVIVLTNLGLALFNLIPIPPLDGSKILFSIIPPSIYSKINFLERYSFFILLFFIFFFSAYLFPIIRFLFYLITGVNF